MPIDSVHPQYAAHEERWMRCRDVYAGGDQVKGRGVLYLPALDGQRRDQYEAYLQRTMFFNGTRRSAAGLMGSVFRKDPTVRFPERLESQLLDVTLADDPLVAVAMRLFEEVMVVGRAGVLVDRPRATQQGRPYWVRYGAEDILNWRTSNVNGDSQLTRVVLRERQSEAAPSDRFAETGTEQIRVLELIDGRYTVSVFRKVERSQKFEEVPSERAEPTRRGVSLDFIPFTFLAPASIAARVELPPLLDLVDINLSHYRSSADLEHGRHFVALPTPWVTGVRGNTNPLQIGPSVAWRLENPQSKVGMLEFTGQGLGALEKALESKERLMMILGARLLEQQPTHAETAEAVRLRHSGSHQSLKTMALALDLAITQLLRTHAWWEGIEPTAEQPIDFTTNKEFFEMRLTADEVKALVLAWQAGGVSFETMYANLQRGDWARPGVDVDSERHAIDAGRTMLEGED